MIRMMDLYRWILVIEDISGHQRRIPLSRRYPSKINAELLEAKELANRKMVDTDIGWDLVKDEEAIPVGFLILTIGG